MILLPSSLGLLQIKFLIGLKENEERRIGTHRYFIPDLKYPFPFDFRVFIGYFWCLG